jgi:GMP synthase-like glutamine amidotransferase
MFQRLLSASAPDTQYRIYDLTQGVFPGSLDECGGWLFTGSKWSVYDDLDWVRGALSLVVRLHESRRPTVGICFGHQLVAQALGGRVARATQGWGVGVHTAHIEPGRAWMVPWAAQLSLIVSHQDQVMALPEGATVLAHHDFCAYDMLQIDEHILTFQGHPEFSKELSNALMERRRERLGEATYQRGIASLSEGTDEGVAARWIIRFLARANEASADAVRAAGSRSG